MDMKADVKKNAIQRIVSLALAKSRNLEISASMAVKYIMHGTKMICSHDFSTVHIYAFIKMMTCDSDCPHKLVKLSEDEYTPVKLVSDYIFRRQDLEWICLYEFLCSMKW